MRVILFRHGIAVDREDPACPPDPQRALTPEGVERTRLAAGGLGALGARPALILTSPYLRARQTADLAAEALGVPARAVRTSDALLPEAEPALIFAELAALAVGEVLCAGHAPHLDLALAHAVGAPRELTALKKAGAACLDVDERRLIWLVEPKQLRRLRNGRS